MFCNQCEQTAKGAGCTVKGVCGKEAQVALQQDQLVYLLRMLSFLVDKAEKKDIDVVAYDDFISEALFATLTNVNFDPASLRLMQVTAVEYCRALAAMTGEAPEELTGDVDALIASLSETAVGLDACSPDRDVNSAMQMLLFGLRGVCAYKTHAARLGERDRDLSAFVRKGLIAGSKWAAETPDMNGWLALILECGKANLTAMKLLDAGNTGHFGNPEPSTLSLGHKKGKAILISGHDLLDLEELLKQTEGSGINVYTHGEMLPAHGYPKLRAWPHLAGNFGTAWWTQQKELPHFPGPVLFTTNCLQNPGSYKDKIFTTGNMGWPGCRHCHNHDFSELIAKAQEMEGFAEDEPGREIMTGFGHAALLKAAPDILKAVADGALKHIFLVGGCDGARPSRNYYAEFVEKTPKDTLVLTLACGKFRFYDKDLGKLGDFPRLIDCGQCNDAYTAIVVADALAKALNCGINDLPLSLVISWYEQKAVAILFTLLALGVRNIILGPTLPAFVSPGILKILTETFGLRLMTTPEEDMKYCLERK